MSEILLPAWLPAEIGSMSDVQVAGLVRQLVQLEELRAQRDLMDRERCEHYQRTYRSLPLWQRLKVRTGFLKI